MKSKKITALSFILLLSTHSSHATMPIERVSVDILNNLNPNGASTQASVSDDGRYIVFESTAGDLVAGDTNGIIDIFRFDRVARSTIRVNEAVGGGNANNQSTFSNVSDDGRYVVFGSRATNLTTDTYPSTVTNPDDTNFTIQPDQIFLYDAQADTTTLISTVGGTSTSTNAANNVSTKPVISGNGRYVVYESYATNILGSDTDSTKDLYRYDTVTGTTVLVSVNTSGTKGSSDSEEAAVSYDGRYIAFTSDAPNLGGTNDLITDVFLRDMITGTTRPVTTGSSGPSGFTDSQQPAISDDGKFVVFESYRTDLVSNPDTNTAQDVFLYNTNSGTYTLISQTSGGTAGNGRSGHVAISTDGRYIAFESAASDLDDSTTDSNSAIDVFVYDTELSKMTQLSTDATGAVGADLAEKPRISSDGRFVVFSSKSALVSDDTQAPQVLDIYMTDSAQAKDFNRNGTADVVWRNTSSGSNWLYEMNGSSITSSVEINEVADLNWKIVGIGDFDGDGKSDLFWRHQTLGTNWVYLMDGEKIKTSMFLNKASSEWSVVGVGDLNADGKDDIIWRNTSIGRVWGYLMDGTTIATSRQITKAGLDWKVRAVADFNGDGRDDILWRNTTNGRNWMYLMNGITIAESRFFGVAGVEWELEGAADFNRDGTAEVLWRNSTTGRMRMFTVAQNGYTVTADLLVGDLSNNWQIKYIGDFNNDKKADIFFRNNTTGVQTFGYNWVYLMDGNTIDSSEFVNQVQGLNWQPVDLQPSESSYTY